MLRCCAQRRKDDTTQKPKKESARTHKPRKEAAALPKEDIDRSDEPKDFKEETTPKRDVRSGLDAESLATAKEVWGVDLDFPQGIEQGVAEDLTSLLKAERQKVDAQAASEVPKLPHGAKIEEDCVVCLENSPEVCILPCKHCCMCSSCLRSLTLKHQTTKGAPRPTCPLCREPIKEQVTMELSKIPKITSSGQKKREAVKMVVDEAKRIVDAIEASGQRVKLVSPVYKCAGESLYHVARQILEQVKWQAPAGRQFMRFSLVFICAGDDNVWKGAFPVLVKYFQGMVPAIEAELAGHQRMLQVALGDMRAMMQTHARDVMNADLPKKTRERSVKVFALAEETCNAALLRLIERKKAEAKRRF